MTRHYSFLRLIYRFVNVYELRVVVSDAIVVADEGEGVNSLAQERPWSGQCYYTFLEECVIYCFTITVVCFYHYI